MLEPTPSAFERPCHVNLLHRVTAFCLGFSMLVAGSNGFALSESEPVPAYDPLEILTTDAPEPIDLAVKDAERNRKTTSCRPAGTATAFPSTFAGTIATGSPSSVADQPG